MSEFKVILRQLREAKGMTQDELAKKLNVSKSAISMYENGKRVPDWPSMELLADTFNVDMNYLLGYTDKTTVLPKSSTSGISIPIVGTIVAGMPADAYDEILGYEEISSDLAKSGEFICLKIKGESMTPVLQENDLVVIKFQPDVDSGDIAAIRVNGDEATIKQVQKTETGIILTAFNPAVYPPHFYSNAEIESLPVEIIGKVVEMHRSF